MHGRYMDAAHILVNVASRVLGTYPSLKKGRVRFNTEGAVIALHRHVAELGLLVKEASGLLEDLLHLVQLGIGAQQLLRVAVELNQLRLLLLQLELRGW